jgi:Tfp pilus assembly protein PilO
MKRNRTIIMTILAAIFAVALWGAFIFSMISLQGEKRMLEAEKNTQLQAATRGVYDSSLRSLARNTHDARLQLNSITGDRDIVNIIETLEEAGESAGLEISIDAVSGGLDNGILRSIVVAISSEGSFEEATHLLALLESLPAAGMVEQFEIEKSKVSDSIWQIFVRERVLVESRS